MKLVAISQRVIDMKEYAERRDGLDQNWVKFLIKCNFIPIVLPNNLEAVQLILKKISVQGIILTGGNDLVAYGGSAPERDEVEEYCINYSIDNKLPLLGVCRGMQVIQAYFGVNLVSIKGHISNEQNIIYNQRIIMKNSFHNWGTRETVNKLQVLARSEDGIIKAVKHTEYPIQGIMWHPERIIPFSLFDIDMFCNHFNT